MPVTLRSIFNSTKDELAVSISGLVLPKDATLIQQKISDYLNHVCDSESEYRQNLTQSEDYILQAALSMLNAQRDFVSLLSKQPTYKVEQSAQSINNFEKSQNNHTVSETHSLLGAGGGALVGKLIFGGWGAVFGALAGTAIVLYLSRQATQTPHNSLTAPTPNVKVIDQPVDVPSLLSVIEQLCESLDNLVETFRAQIQRVINKYESQEKPTIERNYRMLLDGIQSLVGFKRAHTPSEEKYVPKLQTKIEDLAELLDNYHLEVVDYSEEKSNWFDLVESVNVSEIKSILPAIVKNGNVVIKGRVFIPKA